VKYIVFRHDNAFGNSAEQIIVIAQAIAKNKDFDPRIYVENNWQKSFASLIPQVRIENIHVIGQSINPLEIQSRLDLPIILQDALYPSYYRPNDVHTYKCGWEHISRFDGSLLKYRGNRSESFDVVIQFRERGTWDRRVDGRLSDPQRDVKTKTYHRLILALADSGLRVARIGDAEQSKLPTHRNIKDFALDFDKDLERDIALIAQARLFVTSDSSLWPLAAGLGKKVLMTNVTSIFPPYRTHKVLFYKIFFPVNRLLSRNSDILAIKPEIMEWLNPKISIVLKKKLRVFGFAGRGVIVIQDNTFSEMYSAITKLLKV
jgi:putative glycosyltransferase (TIGR04372 family)